MKSSPSLVVFRSSFQLACLPLSRTVFFVAFIITLVKQHRCPVRASPDSKVPENRVHVFEMPGSQCAFMNICWMNEWQVLKFLPNVSGVSFLLTEGEDVRFFLHIHFLSSNKSHCKPYYRFCEIPMEINDPPIYCGSFPQLFGFLKFLLSLLVLFKMFSKVT